MFCHSQWVPLIDLLHNYCIAFAIVSDRQWAGMDEAHTPDSIADSQLSLARRLQAHQVGWRCGTALGSRLSLVICSLN